MRIIFVRHGHPNYRLDCLTEIGHLQGNAVAERLAHEKIDRICSSSCGRARETAEHIAKKHDLPVITYDFMREIGWGSVDGTPLFQNGHPWFIIDAMIENGENLHDPDWEKNEYFRNNEVTFHVKRVTKGFDEWLSSLGYQRDGNYYRVIEKNTENVIMTSHGGASCAALAHLFSVPFPLATAMFSANYTGITIVTLNGETGQLTLPRFELMNDAKHIEGIEAVQYFGK
ncbi:MAG: histidine phosphatase family protein [Clostridia bacterium]|nr:histidine phosphatase family protein [Clostridia bacterium]